MEEALEILLSSIEECVGCITMVGVSGGADSKEACPLGVVF